VMGIASLHPSYALSSPPGRREASPDDRLRPTMQ
jgi:hypothetical protein